MSKPTCTCPNTCAATAPGAEAPLPAEGWLLRYELRRMDCPAEERLVRLALADITGIEQLRIDLSQRQLLLCLAAPNSAVEQAVENLQLAARCLESRPLRSDDHATDNPTTAQAQRQTLCVLLALNGLMFVAELLGGWWAQSSGLLADSLDMLADASVYGLALWAVGHDLLRQRRAAHYAGWVQAALAVLILADVVRRFLYGSEPQSTLMLAMGGAALAVNLTCLWLVHRQRHGGTHMRASLIFSANDVLANLGLLLAAGLVAWSGSAYPDLLIGLLIVALVLFGAWRILRLP